MPDPVPSRLSVGKPDYTALEFPAPPEDRPYVVTNMVMSLDGSVVVEGTERGLGSTVDQALMRELRVPVDVVMNGAGTLRASGTSSRVASEEQQALRRARGLPPHPLAAVLTASGDLPLERAFFTERDFEAVVFVADTASSERRTAIAATGRPLVVLPAAGFLASVLLHLRHERDARVLLAEGGPHLLGALFALGAVDEYFLTLGPVVVAGDAPLTAALAARPPTIEALTRFDLLSAALEPSTGELYLHYRRVGRAG